MLDHGAPEDEHVDARILPARGGVLRHGERRLRRGRPPRLDPGQPAGLQLADDLAGDFVIEARPAMPERAAVLLDIADLRDGRRRPLLQPSTRHGNPVRTLTLKGALRGAGPAEGGGRDPGSAAGEGFPLKGLSDRDLQVTTNWRGSDSQLVVEPPAA